MRKTPHPRDVLDPQILEFAELLKNRSAAHPRLDSLPVTSKRLVAEDVRRPLNAGGPAVECVQEHTVRVGERDVPVRIINTAPGRRRPAMIFLHGGGWMLFSLRTHDRIMRELATHADIAIVGIEYSLSPEVRFPAQLDEIRAVCEWLEQSGDQHGVDTLRLAIGGDSAGANLSIGTCLRLRDEGRGDLISGMLLCYGVYDRRFDTDSYMRFGEPEFVLSRDEMREFWASYLQSETDHDNPLASPLRADVAGLPPAFLTVAECDVLYDENIKMAEKLRASGVDAESVVYAGTTHSFLEAVSMADVSKRAIADASRWLNDTLNRPDKPAEDVLQANR